MKRAIQLFLLGTIGLILTGCGNGNVMQSVGPAWNTFITVLGICAGAVVVFFIVAGVITVFYKGKDVDVKVLKKKETKVLQNKTSAGYRGQSDLSRRARRQKGRIRYNKVVVELDGKKKTLKCNDIVIFDKLSVGKVNHVRIRFSEIIKLFKD